MAVSSPSSLETSEAAHRDPGPGGPQLRDPAWGASLRTQKSPGPGGRGSSAGVGDTGIEPVTSSVSGKRATAAPIARDGTGGCRSRWVRDSNPCTRLCRPLPRLSANPPGDALASYGTALPTRGRERRPPGADDRIRTGDPHLGKVMLYQLSYVRRTGIRRTCRGRYWDRTSDLFRVKEARYRCANRPEVMSALSIGLEEAYMLPTGARATSGCDLRPGRSERRRTRRADPPAPPTPGPHRPPRSDRSGAPPIRLHGRAAPVRRGDGAGAPLALLALRSPDRPAGTSPPCTPALPLVTSDTEDRPGLHRRSERA